MTCGNKAADRVLDALETTLVKLVKNPGIGHWREELAGKQHRFFLVYSYLIVYRHEAKPLQSVPILHAARDVQSVLGNVAGRTTLADLGNPRFGPLPSAAADPDDATRVD